MNLEFANLSLVILLPLVPAFLLFWKLPSKADVTGPLQGLNLKLGGAFAGYFALLLLVFWTHNIWNPPPAWQVWDVSGTFTDENGAAIQASAPDIALIPGSTNAYPNGMFTLRVPIIPTQGGGMSFPSVMVTYQGFQQVTIPLDPAEGANLGLARDENEHRIKIPAIHLKKIPEYSPHADSEKKIIAAKGTQP
jgi:hypothetical protein